MSELDTVPPVKSKNDDEISLLDLFAIIWNRKLFVIIFDYFADVSFTRNFNKAPEKLSSNSMKQNSYDD